MNMRKKQPIRLDQAGHSLGQRGVTWARGIAGLAMGGVHCLSRSLAVMLLDAGDASQRPSVDLLVQELSLRLEVMSAAIEAE